MSRRSALATVVITATDWPDDLARAVRAVRATSPAGTSLVIVANSPSPEQAAVLEALEAEVAGVPGSEIVWTSDRLGHAAALNAGLRRAAGPIVIVLDTSVESTGDIVTPLVRALDDPTVALAGGWGIVSKDLRHFDDAPPGDVDAIEGYALAFRRGDYEARGPLDEKFTFYRNLDIWWSLVLRDEGPDRHAAARRRRSACPQSGMSIAGTRAFPTTERDRLSKRNFYRILDRFGARRDLVGRALDPPPA